MPAPVLVDPLERGAGAGPALALQVAVEPLQAALLHVVGVADRDRSVALDGADPVPAAEPHHLQRDARDLSAR